MKTRKTVFSSAALAFSMIAAGILAAFPYISSKFRAPDIGIARTDDISKKHV